MDNLTPSNSARLNTFFMPDFCNTRAVIILLAVSEALVLAVTLIESSLLQFSWQRFSIVSFFVQWVCLLSVALICPLRKVFVNWSAWRASGLAILIVVLVTLLISVVGELQWSGYTPHVDWLWVAKNCVISTIFATMAMRYFYVQSQWRQKTQAELQSRLAALQAHIRPHFFFNTLNTVASLIALDADKAETMLLDLSELFRAVLKDEHSLIPLQQEITLGKRYLAIEQVRLGEDRLTIHWNLPSELPNLRVPQLLLQPLLENAIYHGIQPSIDSGFIEINLQPESASWQLSIRNSKPSSPAVTGNQIAQANICARLAVLGQGARLQITETETDYCASVWLPNTVVGL